jgi:tetratricopeptide (TPR) repeat protein
MGIAHALQTVLTNGGERVKLCGPAREAEKMALELDPNMGDALVMLATNRRLCTWEIAEAETEYRRAIDVSPNSAHVRRFYAVNLANEKRFDEALDHLRVAQQLEPNNSFNERLVGRVLFLLDGGTTRSRSRNGYLKRTRRRSKQALSICLMK